MATQDGTDDGAGGAAVGGGRGKIPQTSAQRPDGVQRPRRRAHGTHSFTSSSSSLSVACRRELESGLVHSRVGLGHCILRLEWVFGSSGRVGLFHSILRLEWVGLCRVGLFHSILRLEWVGLCQVGLFHSILRIEWVRSGCFTVFSVLSGSGCVGSGRVVLQHSLS